MTGFSDKQQTIVRAVTAVLHNDGDTARAEVAESDPDGLVETATMMLVGMVRLVAAMNEVSDLDWWTAFLTDSNVKGFFG